jgi:protein SCO1/2
VVRTLPILILSLIFAAGCARQEPAKEYPITGQIVGIKRDAKQLTVKHEDIPGLMPGMIMSFDVVDPGEIDRRAVGELITATLVVQEYDTRLKDITVTGKAPVDAAITRNSTTPVLEAGETVPDAEFTDQDGRPRRFSEFRGSGVVLTFIYTRCPLPDFCPRLERNLRDAQDRLAKDARLRENVRLVAVTFDPRYDTPAVLKKRATDIGVDPAVWTYLTGDSDKIEEFAARFGVTIIRNPADEKDIRHNLRTALLAPDGTVVDVLSGSDWKAEDALASLERASAPVR